jgi:hypothetical protein
MKDYDALTFPGPAMSRCSYRALHSFMVDALMDAPRELRIAVIDTAGGISSGHMMLAVLDGRMRVDVRIEQEQPWVWLSYATPDGMRPVVAVQGREIGADPALLLREQEIRVEDAIAEILGGSA